jgi:hypothetical protein
MDDGGWIEVDEMGYVVNDAWLPWNSVQYWQSPSR